MRYFLKKWADGSVCLDTNPDGTADQLQELTEAEAREFYATAPTIDVINSEIADKFDREHEASLPNKVKIDAALKSWIGEGDIRADRRNAYDERVVVVYRSESGDYDVFRAFMIGTTAHVSADQTAVEAEAVMQHLLDNPFA